MFGTRLDESGDCQEPSMKLSIKRISLTYIIAALY